jgi:RNA polymerase sigma-70 factor (ECF subfamily)
VIPLQRVKEQPALNRVEEQQLVRQAQKGDSDAFATLYQAHVQAIYRYVVHRVTDPQLAEDLTGDVFTKAIKGLASYRDEGNPFLAWLYRIAHARVIDYYRRQGRRPTEADVDEMPIPIEVDLDTPMLRQQIAELLRGAMAALTDEQQQVLLMRFVDGMKLEEVAQVLGKNANAIKALQHRALRALASRLERQGVDIESIITGLS